MALITDTLRTVVLLRWDNMSRKISLGMIGQKAQKKNITFNIEQFCDYLKFDRGQSNNSVVTTKYRAIGLIQRYGMVEYTPEFCRRVWSDYESDGAAPQTIKHMLHTVELMAASDGVLLKSKKPKLIKKEIDFLTVVEVNAVIDAARNLNERAILVTLAHTGIRASELCSLTVDAVDLGRRLLCIRGQTKNRVERTIVVSKAAAAAISEWIEHRETLNLPHNSIFVNKYGLPLNRTILFRLVRELGQAAGIEKPVYPHLLRHSAATAMVRTLPIDVAMRQLGHQSVDVTMRYTHSSVDEMRRLVDEKFVV